MGNDVKFLVTGGAGFIGSCVVRWLVAAGEEVMVLDALTYAGHRESLGPALDAPNYAFRLADIRDGQAVRRVFAETQPDAVIHLAAESHVDRSIDSPMDFVATNVQGTVTLLQAATEYWHGLGPRAQEAFRFLHVSTDEVYGSLGTTGVFTEATPYRPNSPYSASKAASDHFVRAWHRTFGLPVLISHCSNNYGPYQMPEKLIPVTILAALEGRPIPVYGDGKNVRDWLFVEDHARALELIVRKGEPGQIYNVGADAETANIDMVRAICGWMDELIPDSPYRPHVGLVTFVADRPGHDRRYAIDSSRVRHELGWRPALDLHEGLGRTVRWYLENRWWWQATREGGFEDGRRQGVGVTATTRGGTEAKRPKVLLLGPNGQLGHDILYTHAQAGEPFELHPIGRDRLDVSSPKAIKWILGGMDYDVLVNATAYNLVDKAEDNTTLAFDINTRAVATMADACADNGARFFHVSTDYVFGGDAARTRPLREDDPTAPVNVYGTSKALGEALARLACNDTVILRVASLFGTTGASGKGGNFVETMIRLGREKGALRVVDDQTMSPTATADVARVLLRMLAEGCAPGLYHVVNGGSATWFEFAREIVRLAGVETAVTPCSSEEYPTRAARPRYSVLDNAKISPAFGTMPPWQDALERYLRAKGHRNP